MSNNSPLPAPSPMAGKNQPVDWMLAFKFNAASFPGCTDDGVTPTVGSTGIFGGVVEEYKSGHSQQYIYATSENPTLVKGQGCLGATFGDPLGATFAQVYNNPGYNYVLWNDQFYGEPIASLESPWGHSKGMAAWNDAGEGFVLQVSTPSWPGSGSRADPRNTGNTLGAIGDDDDIEVSQHFLALKINKDDLVAVLKALINASVATDVTQPPIVHNGGPADVMALVNTLGIPASERTEKTPRPSALPSPPTCTTTTLSSGVQLLSKPSGLHLPPWQLVSGKLGGLSLRVASWWASPEIYSTDKGVNIEGWPSNLPQPGAVAIATTGNWNGKSIGLTGGLGTNFNHAKIGISTDPAKPVCIFGDMNQQGALRSNYAHPGQKMDSSQNGRGGTFYVLQNKGLFDSLTQLLKGSTAGTTAPPVKAPTKKTKPGTGKSKKSTTVSKKTDSKPNKKISKKVKAKNSSTVKPAAAKATKKSAKKKVAKKKAASKRKSTPAVKAKPKTAKKSKSAATKKARK